MHSWHVISRTKTGIKNNVVGNSTMKNIFSRSHIRMAQKYADTRLETAGAFSVFLVLFRAQICFKQTE